MTLPDSQREALFDPVLLLLEDVSSYFISFLSASLKRNPDTFATSDGPAAMSLTRALQDWVEGNEGVRHCGGDYTLFLRIALDVVRHFENYPKQTANGKPYVIGERMSVLLDRDWWTQQVWEYTYERRRR